MSYMKQFKYLFLLMLAIAPFTTNAQELIKNGDFELTHEYNAAPMPLQVGTAVNPL